MPPALLWRTRNIIRWCYWSQLLSWCMFDYTTPTTGDVKAEMAQAWKRWHPMEVNRYHAKLLWEIWTYILVFVIVYLHWEGKCSWNVSPVRHGGLLSYIINSMYFDELLRKGAKAFVVIELTWIYSGFCITRLEGLTAIWLLVKMYL